MTSLQSSMELHSTVTRKQFLISILEHIDLTDQSQQPLYYYSHLKADSMALDLYARFHFDEDTQLPKQAAAKI